MQRAPVEYEQAANYKKHCESAPEEEERHCCIIVDESETPTACNVVYRRVDDKSYCLLWS